MSINKILSSLEKSWERDDVLSKIKINLSFGPIELPIIPIDFTESSRKYVSIICKLNSLFKKYNFN